MEQEVRLARAWLVRAAEPGNPALWRYVDQYGPAEAAGGCAPARHRFTPGRRLVAAPSAATVVVETGAPGQRPGRRRVRADAGPAGAGRTRPGDLPAVRRPAPAAPRPAPGWPPRRRHPRRPHPARQLTATGTDPASTPCRAGGPCLDGAARDRRIKPTSQEEHHAPPCPDHTRAHPNGRRHLAGRGRPTRQPAGRRRRVPAGAGERASGQPAQRPPQADRHRRDGRLDPRRGHPRTPRPGPGRRRPADRVRAPPAPAPNTPG